MQQQETLWNQENYEQVTYALVETIGKSAEATKRSINFNCVMTEADFYQRAARETITQVSDTQHQDEVADPLKLGGKKFHAYLEYAKTVTKPSETFKPFHKVILKFSKNFDKAKKKNLEVYRSEGCVDAIDMCFEAAQTKWCRKQGGKISNLYGKLRYAN